ncbi:murein L,D-transpeptidase [Corynebacterium diphtheriae]|nr:murein L,D-transpeptidase [Corynebacterium diphtheriae]CAB0682283.1 murein L,D-transpeptidase [Corynebacterium diphtheriae]CAB0684618.1 murein L,D-transpeptidase [Corynebacterium diphtheriae]CAB0685211.1 murein L,D-transpeptidase [Corynebacterium diphtheriae]CAB0721110.1 murein L,D-transpeptidase [Corynebacterium diphtheriae]
MKRAIVADMTYKPRHAKPSALAMQRRRIGALAGTTVMSAALLMSQQAPASAQDLSSGSSISSSVNEQLQSIGQQTRDGAWNMRNALHAQANMLPPEAAQALKDTIDATVNLFFPGLIQERSMPVLPLAPAPAPAPAAPGFDRGTCPPAAKACVDLAQQRAWLQNNGQVVYGAVPISSGRPGWETPPGVFHVNRKVKDEISREFGNAPMPYSVYFTNNGIAFHQDSPNVMSHGCIHLWRNDAIRFFDTLQYGDMVYVY